MVGGWFILVNCDGQLSKVISTQRTGTNSKQPLPAGYTLLMEEIRNNHLGCIKPVVNNGINYQPQLVQDFSHQQ